MMGCHIHCLWHPHLAEAKKKVKHPSEVGVLRKELHNINLTCDISLSNPSHVSQAQCSKLRAVQQRLSRKKATNAHKRIFIEDLGAWETLDMR